MNVRDVPLGGLIGADITPHGLRSILDEPGPVRLWLASPGGEHAAAVAIYHEIRARPDTSIHILRAASAAALIAVAADHRTIAPHGRILIHRAATATAGTAADLKRQADALAALDSSMLAILAERTGQDIEPALDAAGGELWLDAELALARGFVHAIEPAGPAAALPVVNPARDSLVRAEQTLRSKLARIDNPARGRALLEHARSAGQVDAAYSEFVAALDTDVADAIARDGLEAVKGKADEALRRVREATVQALAHVRRQLRALSLGGIPATLPVVPSWTCRCGGQNFHEPGDAYRLASCFHCEEFRNGT